MKEVEHFYFFIAEDNFISTASPPEYGLGISVLQIQSFQGKLFKITMKYCNWKKSLIAPIDCH